MTKSWVRKNWIPIAALAVVLAVCTALLAVPYLSRPKIIVTFAVPMEYPGFQVYPTPRTFDPPGTLFTLNGNERKHVGHVKLQPKKEGDEAFLVATTTDQWNGDVLAQYLGTNPAQLNLKSNQKITVKVQLSGGERWRIDTQSLPSALKEVWWPTSDDAPIIEDHGTPYVTTEAIAVRGINYDVVIDTTQGGSVETPKIVSADGSVSVQKTSVNGYTLNQSFSQPHYVFFAASKVIVAPGLNEPHWIIEPEDERLTWSSEQLTPLRPSE